MALENQCIEDPCYADNFSPNQGELGAVRLRVDRRRDERDRYIGSRMANCRPHGSGL